MLLYIFFKFNSIFAGKYYGEDFSQMNRRTFEILFSDTLTKFHLQAMCCYFGCRIGIFMDDEKWERYGDWDDKDANIFTFLMKKDAQRFSPILSLK